MALSTSCSASSSINPKPSSYCNSVSLPSLRDDLQTPSLTQQGPQGPPPMVAERFQSVIRQLFQYGIIRWDGAVDDDMANITVDPTKDIVVYVDSPGESVTAGMAIFDTTRHIRLDVSTVCVGLAASMGAFLLSASTIGKRYSLPNSRIMIHQLLGGAQGGQTDIDIQHERSSHQKLKFLVKESLRSSNRLELTTKGETPPKLVQEFEESSSEDAAMETVQGKVCATHTTGAWMGWDCGITCVLMVLRALSYEVDRSQLEKLCSTRSTWTIDLAYLLHAFGVSFCYYTLCVGVNPNLLEDTFYQDDMNEDYQRVSQLFLDAAHIHIENKSLTGQELSWLVMSPKIAIVLVDYNILRQHSLDESDDNNYAGHYIVVCGFDSYTHEFEIRDPASLRVEKITLEQLEKARRAFGTDEDILLVSWQSAL